MIWLRSALFAATLCITTPVFSLIALATFPFSAFTRYRIITQWSRLTIFFARVILGIRYRVLGLERLPARPSVVLSKHQSAWETLAFQEIFPPQVIVVKKSLLYIPFFGWGLAMLSPIAVNRRSPRESLKQLLRQGKERLARGFWVIVYPEGTRVAPGERGRYQVGGAWLAAQTGTPVVPVAVNAGRLWGRNAFLKRPGLVTVSIGEPIDTAGLKAEEVLHRAEDWIEAEMQRIDRASEEG
ncbi:lysophospholipid acyltransferase family protein [Pelomicrobium methylotrophicum]|uniref:1-acyl-sn-glycerol-3-phosphate acyltransferase n=1 Tax=Pelomicrobium methylotrophicum TaxID=2602750 RepID=A0A5C7EU75_9PROT|nr:lysophospholipid acyltransferase family protein [Pelomicrobium methylotrophicum]TXF10617.1 1-acyl-sn-glycerol-3-phosphate acyltransferase [Pelomicrobium methylotrophicum]